MSHYSFIKVKKIKNTKKWFQSIKPPKQVLNLDFLSEGHDSFSIEFSNQARVDFVRRISLCIVDCCYVLTENPGFDLNSFLDYFFNCFVSQKPQQLCPVLPKTHKVSL